MVITVSGKDLKQAFSDIAPLIKKSEMSSSVAIGYEDDVLYITADAGMKYQCDIPVQLVIDPVSMSLTVWFRDISDFIGARDTVNITISEITVGIETEGFSTSLLTSGAVISRFKPSEGTKKDIIFNTLQYAVQKMSSTTTLSKALQLTKPIIFAGDSAYIKYSTVWIKCISSGINSILSIDDAKTIINFKPKSVVIGTTLEFHKDNAVLVVPNTVSTPEREFDSIVDSMETVTSFDTEGVFSVVQKLYRVIGNTNCKAYVFDSGLEIEIKTPTSSLSKKIKVNGDFRFSFEAPLEFILLCFNLLGEDVVTIKRKDGLICLSSNQLTILLSVA